MNHTKEPWRMYQQPSSVIVSDELPDLLCSTFTTCLSAEQMNANAQRIVACVNACAGITDEALEAGVVACGVNNLRDNIPDGNDQFYFDNVKVFEEDV